MHFIVYRVFSQAKTPDSGPFENHVVSWGFIFLHQHRHTHQLSGGDVKISKVGAANFGAAGGGGRPDGRQGHRGGWASWSATVAGWWPRTAGRLGSLIWGRSCALHRLFLDGDGVAPTLRWASQRGVVARLPPSLLLHHHHFHRYCHDGCRRADADAAGMPERCESASPTILGRSPPYFQCNALEFPPLGERSYQTSP